LTTSFLTNAEDGQQSQQLTVSQFIHQATEEKLGQNNIVRFLSNLPFKEHIQVRVDNSILHQHLIANIEVILFLIDSTAEHFLDTVHLLLVIDV